jgi:hypothetical protein
LPSILIFALSRLLDDGPLPKKQSTSRVSTSAKNRISLANLLAVDRFRANPKIQAAAFHDVAIYVPR